MYALILFLMSLFIFEKTYASSDLCRGTQNTMQFDFWKQATYSLLEMDDYSKGVLNECCSNMFKYASDDQKVQVGTIHVNIGVKFKQFDHFKAANEIFKSISFDEELNSICRINARKLIDEDIQQKKDFDLAEETSIGIFMLNIGKSLDQIDDVRVAKKIFQKILLGCENSDPLLIEIRRYQTEVDAFIKSKSSARKQKSQSVMPEEAHFQEKKRTYSCVIL